MDFLIMMFPMIIDQFRAMNQPVPEKVPGFSTSAHIAVGMPVAEMIQQLGMPDSVEDFIGLSDRQKQVFYKGPMCTMSGSSCYVMVKNGKIVRFAHIKPQYMGGI